MSLKSALISILIIPLLAFSMHKYYVSLCEIEYIPKQQSVQIILSIFIDDFELTLNNEFDENLYLATNKEHQNSTTFIKNYLHENFKIAINNKECNYQLLGKKYEDDIVKLYIEIPNISEIKIIEVTNTNLFKYFEDQQNIIKIKAYYKQKTLYLNKENDKGLLKF